MKSYFDTPDLGEYMLAGNRELVEEAKQDQEIIEENGMDFFTLSRLTKEQLWNLRQDIPLCSLYLNDYQNRYDIDPKKVRMFFDGYAEELGYLMEQDGIGDDRFFDELHKYDTIDNLWNWHCDVYCF